MNQITDAHSAYWYLIDEVIPQEVPYVLSDYLDYTFMRVNPKTHAVENNSNKNTLTEVWIEFGILEDGSPCHDYDFDCVAPSFEEAIIKLANLVKTKLGT